jgi:1,4-dihydroxy-2-naphthoate octaprenyltransferase
MLKHWLQASRPKTLVASFLPVVAGFLLAYEQSPMVSKLVGFLCLLYCLLIQIGTNLANDYFDFIKGADSKRENAPVRMVSSGLIKPRTMLAASLFVFFISFVLGIYIMNSVDGSPYLILVGIFSVIFGIGYTAGPFSIAYNGMGDVFVVIFFGFVAVLSTQYVTILSVGLEWKPDWLLPLGVGFVINNLLVVNNYRDFKEDRVVGKKTLVVILGKRFGLVLFLVGVLISTLLIPILVPSAWPTIFLLPFGIFSFWRLPKALTRIDYDKILSVSAATVMGYLVCLLLGYLG